ncbi:MAG: hypothetical protein GY816_21390 [Cytophagales bacterium]|nr:hypothetical protein [Cytophagales bacterium]
MDATHIHLAITHFPIVGTIIGAGILAYGLYTENESINKVALVTLILMALLTIPVFLTGESAEETVEHLAGVSENIVEEHEELAEKAIWLMGALGVLSLISFYAISKKLSISKRLVLLTLITALASFGLFAKVGNLGGQIRHSEIRKNNDFQNEGNPNSTIEKEHDDDEDDDDDDDD